MNANQHPILALLWTFGLMSLFAVGGANSAIPEMQRVAVDVQHWMSDKEFADLFAISQLSPGPNVLIVTLIGSSVAGVAGALVATVAMCGPTAVLAYCVGRLLQRSQHRAGRRSSRRRWFRCRSADGRQRPDPGAKLGSERAGPWSRWPQRLWRLPPGSIRSGCCLPGASLV